MMEQCSYGAGIWKIFGPSRKEMERLVTKKRGRPAANAKAMTPAEKQRGFRERRKAKD